MNNHPCSEETKRKIGEANRGRRHTPEELVKMRIAHLEKKHTQEEIDKIRLSKVGSKNPNYGKKASTETKLKLSIAHSGERNGFYGRHHTQETRQKLSVASAGPRNFNYGKPRNDDTVRKIIKSNHIKPNKAERHLWLILDTNFPGEWTFVGDGQFIVGGLCPDFLNLKSKKMVIELFGDYWHSDKVKTNWKRSELGRVMIYSTYDFKCLVIWEHELKDEDQVAKKVRKWVQSEK